MKKYDVKAILTRAWALARLGVVKFGGKVTEYIAVSMKMAWAEAIQIRNEHIEHMGVRANPTETRKFVAFMLEVNTKNMKRDLAVEKRIPECVTVLEQMSESDACGYYNARVIEAKKSCDVVEQRAWRFAYKQIFDPEERPCRMGIYDTVGHWYGIF